MTEARALDITYRPLLPADQDLLWEYLYLAVFVPPGAPPLPPETVHQPMLARYVAHWGRQHDSGLLAIEPSQGRDVGAAWLCLWPECEVGYGFVDGETPELGMAVRPEYRQRGIGTALLRRLLAEVDTRYGAVSLSVSQANPAVRLYERLGFEGVACQEGFMTMRRLRGEWPR